MPICQSFSIITIYRLSFFSLLETHSSLSTSLSKHEPQNWIQQFSLAFQIRDRKFIHLSCVQQQVTKLIKPSYGSYPENPLFSNKKVSDSFVLEKLIFTITYLPIFACLSRQSNFFWTPPSAATNISILLLL